MIKVNYEMVSGHCKDIADQYGVKVGGVKNLIPNLGDKIKYVVHYKNLEYYLSLGMKLVKIYRISSFRKTNFLKKYPDFNTKKGQESADEFNRGLYKLLNNCIYGKSIGNQRKRMNVKLVYDKKTYTTKIFDKNFVAVHCSKTELILNKPIYVGFCILELSKLLMYQFHYNYVLKTFSARLLFKTLTV